MPTDGGMDKEDVIYVYNRILLSHGKEWKAVCSKLDGPKMIMLSEVSHTEK